MNGVSDYDMDDRNQGLLRAQRKEFYLLGNEAYVPGVHSLA